jgi:rare lipoprotein A (peptidoglycan hydrolase)
LQVATAISALVVVGCGSGSSAVHTRTKPQATAPHLAKPRAQVVQPVAGNVAPTASVTPSNADTTPGHDSAPTGPATVTDAPAKGAPTDAQVRAAIARFQRAVSRYHLDQINYSGVLLNPAALPAGGWHTSIASVEIAYGHAVACGGIMRPAELGVANKTLPCGTMVTFRYGDRAVRVPVIDRGPYIPGRMWDISGAAAEALRFPGLGPVQWRIG